ncbi:MAG: ester cyclase [Lewinellaceae bacterium]|nr:ester cyclase [Lewinellaceae bacterium]
MKSFQLLIFSIMVLAASCNQNLSKTEYQTMEEKKKTELKALVQKFYDQLSDPNNSDRDGLSKVYMAENWESTPQPIGGPGRQGFVNTLGAFGGMIPDLNWDVKEMLVDGNRVTVRSIASGTPNSPEGHFFGAPTDGSKKFEIMTIDVHTIENGKMVRSYHVEDWATAIQQVSQK